MSTPASRLRPHRVEILQRLERDGHVRSDLVPYLVAHLRQTLTVSPKRTAAAISVSRERSRMIERGIRLAVGAAPLSQRALAGLIQRRITARGPRAYGLATVPCEAGHSPGAPADAVRRGRPKVCHFDHVMPSLARTPHLCFGHAVVNVSGEKSMAEVATIEKAKGAKAAAPKKLAEFKLNDKVLREQRQNDWLLVVPDGMNPEDLTKPKMLGAAAANLRPYDQIMAVAKDEGWWAEYLVHDCGVGWATLVLLRAVRLPPREHDTASREPDGHRIFFAGIESKWVVHRTTDDNRMREGFETRELALRWILDHASLRDTTPNANR